MTRDNAGDERRARGSETDDSDAADLRQLPTRTRTTSVTPDPLTDVARLPGGLVRAVAVVLVAGLTITVAASWAAWVLDRHNEDRLLRVQTSQAAALIGAEVVNITSPLETAVHVASATNGSAEQFSAFMLTQIGAGRPFVDASLWRIDGSSSALVTALGDAPEPVASVPAITDLVARSASSDSFTVAGLPAASMSRVAYALTDRTASGWVVVAERAIPANRRVAVESNAAFSNIHFVTYLGRSTRSVDVATTDVTPSELPLRGLTERVEIPFGNTVITLVTSRRSRLGGDLGAELPWIFLAVGLLVTAAAAAVSGHLVRRRRNAENDAATIADLYRRLDDRFGEQRHISETLQRAMLPQRNPAVAGLEVASRYLAGARGVEVGGDWYSIVPVDGDHFAFVVGDVSGRGLSAATVMARLRFTLRAYLIEGHAPDRAMRMCSREIDLAADGHFATVLVGVGDLTTREITLANAGHLNPLVITSTGTDYITTKVGVPLGVASSADYEATTYVMSPGSTLLAFTDGLVERRREDLLQGLDRLAAAAPRDGFTLDDALTAILTAMHHDGSEDDIAVLAFRWLDDQQVADPATTALGAT
jgi:serine phosphatase RsbU (regulator of sigma subunit)